ncbi:uncharacterized protein LOC123596429 [Leopardus geoffroyi]|uniref:uncharacterized protein LOC123596429 n=1 Tax=Leopardus geoffroyi TaxID=46844 RepID=UPI001E25F1A4|nr:uncharacterized protein LOC123596429 [Leopardus geoffroyi]
MALRDKTSGEQPFFSLWIPPPLHQQAQPPRSEKHHSQIPPSPYRATLPLDGTASRGASAGRPPLPAGRERRGRGAARNLRQLLLLRPAALCIAPERRPPPPGAERSGARRKRPRSARGVAGRQRASPSAPRPPCLQGQVSAPRTPGPPPAPRAWAGAAPGRTRARRGHLPGSHPASAGGWPQRSSDATRDPPGAGAPRALLP